MEGEQLKNDLTGLAATVRKVRWTEGARERALALAEALVCCDPAEAPGLLERLEALARDPDAVRLSFSEQRRAPAAMALPGGPTLEGQVSAGRELLLFLLSLVRRSLSER